MSIQTPINKYFKSTKMLKSNQTTDNKIIEEISLCDSDKELESSLINISKSKRKKYSDYELQTNENIKKKNSNSKNNAQLAVSKDMICINKSDKETGTTKKHTTNVQNHPDNKLFNTLMINQKTKTENSRQCNVNSNETEYGNFELTNTVHDLDISLDENTSHSYQTVFLMELINSVLSNDNNKSLFTSEENKLISVFLNLSHEGRTFCSRLFFRKNSWHRLFNFISSIQLEIPEEDAIILTKHLCDNGFILTDYSQEDPKVLLNLCSSIEIKQLHTKYKLSKVNKTNKYNMIESILKNVKQQTTLSFSKSSVSIFHENIKNILKTCVKLSSFTRNLFLKVQLLYSLTNRMLKLPNDLYRLFWDVKTKKVKFPNYIIDHPKIFINIDHFNRYEIAHNLRVRLEEAIILKDISEGVYIVLKAYQILNEVIINPDYEQEYLHLPKYLHRFTTGYSLISLVSTGIDILKTEASGKCSKLVDANLSKKKDIITSIFHSECLTYAHICEILCTLVNQNIYLKSKKGLWYEQLSLIYYTHLKKIETSAYMILMALETEILSEVHQLKFSQRAEKLVKPTSKLSDELKAKLKEKMLPPKKQKNRVITASAVPETLPGHKRIYVQNELDGNTYAGVEQIAINHYVNKEGYERGLHFEGTTVVTLFGLLFWDIIYEYHVPNTFITPIQESPLDLYSSEFYQNRKVIIDDRLNQLINNTDIDSVLALLNNNILFHSKEESIVNKDLCRSPEMLIDIVNCMGIKILGKICERLSQNFGLSQAGFPDLLLWSRSKNNCKFVEVKGQHDKLSEKQILWLEYLTDIGADVEVCHVHTQGTKKSKKVSDLS